MMPRLRPSFRAACAAPATRWSALPTASGEKMARAAIYDAAIVDLMLPGRAGRPLTLIPASARNQAHDPHHRAQCQTMIHRQGGLPAPGADDYLSKPFELPELLARIEAVLRRTGETSKAERLENSGVTIDLVGRTVRRDGQKIDLPPLSSLCWNF